MNTQFTENTYMIRPFDQFSNYLGLKMLYEIKQRESKIYEKSDNLNPFELSRKKNLVCEISDLENRLNKILNTLSSYEIDHNHKKSRHEAFKLQDERTLAECHFINGLSMEKSAEAMNISRDTAYRILRRIKTR